MKTASLLFAALFAVTPVFAALDDDLFHSAANAKQPTARSYTHRGKVYGNVRIMSMDGNWVTLHSKQGQVRVPFDELPKLWQDAMHKRNWPINAKSPKPMPGPKTLAEWEKARSEAELVARREAAHRYPSDFSFQLSNVERDMEAWEKLYPRPASPKKQSVVDQPLSEIPDGPEYDPEIDASQVYWEARTEAENEVRWTAHKAYPNTPDRRAEKASKLLQLWDEANPAPKNLLPLDKVKLRKNPFFTKAPW